jgi:hypothetical protein
MSMGIVPIGLDGQEELPGYFQNLAEEMGVFESLKKLKVSRFYDLVVWGAMDGEESAFHPATLILKEAEKIQNWLTKNEDWDEFECGRDGFLQDLEEFLTAMKSAASAGYSFSLECA